MLGVRLPPRWYAGIALAAVLLVGGGVLSDRPRPALPVAEVAEPAPAPRVVVTARVVQPQPELTAAPVLPPLDYPAGG